MDDRGFWVHASAHQDVQYIPLHTRIQPDKCMGSKATEIINHHRKSRNIPPITISPLSDHKRNQCDKYGDIRPFVSYRFQWHEGIKEYLLQHDETEVKICLLAQVIQSFYLTLCQNSRENQKVPCMPTHDIKHK